MIGKTILAFGVAAALAGGAQAATLTYTTTGAGAYMLFPGQVQETHLVFQGCSAAQFFCQTSLDLTAGTSLTAFSHGVQWPVVGINDGIFPGPSTTFTIDTLFAIGNQTVTVSQQISYRQIANGQFQLDWSDSPTQTIDLGALGQLDITALGGSVQLQPINSGGGGTWSTRFLLHDAPAGVPEPASWALMIGGLGLAGAALRRRPKAALPA